MVHFIDMFNTLGSIEMRVRTQVAEYAPILILSFIMAHRVKTKQANSIVVTPAFFLL